MNTNKFSVTVLEMIQEAATSKDTMIAKVVGKVERMSLVEALGVEAFYNEFGYTTVPKIETVPSPRQYEGYEENPIDARR